MLHNNLAFYKPPRKLPIRSAVCIRRALYWSHMRTSDCCDDESSVSRAPLAAKWSEHMAWTASRCSSSRQDVPSLRPQKLDVIDGKCLLNVEINPTVDLASYQSPNSSPNRLGGCGKTNFRWSRLVGAMSCWMRDLEQEKAERRVVAIRVLIEIIVPSMARCNFRVTLEEEKDDDYEEDEARRCFGPCLLRTRDWQ